MRKITMWLLSTVAVVVLLFSYRTSTAGVTATPARATATTGGGTASGGGTATGSGGGSGYTGSVARTRWGPVQVKVQISNGRITDVTALQVPDDNRRDQEINSYAVPQLRSEVLAAQSASIDTVSGATVTSDGYIESLQAALDAAHFQG